MSIKSFRFSFLCAFFVLIAFMWVRHGVGPIYLNPDGVGYFSYLPSIWVDHDLDFTNQYQEMKFNMPLGYTTNGYVTNIWPIGYALFLSPFFLLGLILKPIGLQWTEFSSNQWLLIFTNAGATLYGLSSCLFAFCALKELKVGAKHALLAATLALIGSPLFFYCFSLPNTAPPLSAFSVSLFLFFWLRQRQRPNTNAATRSEEHTSELQSQR